MKKFLAVYLGSESDNSAKAWEALDQATRDEKEQTGIKAWQNWATKNQKHIVDGGAPIGPTKRVDGKGVSKASNAICAYTIVEAESHEAAAKLFLNHPHFAIFPGESVEVMECLPLPQA